MQKHSIGEHIVVLCVALIFISIWLLCCAAGVRAVTFDDPTLAPFNPRLVNTSVGWSMNESVGWSDSLIGSGASISIPLNEDGVLHWGVGYDQSDETLATYLSSIMGATYTLQLYKGSVGSSTLMYSETVPSGNATSGGSFHFSFLTAGHYLLAYTATYPSGNSSLSSFQQFITKSSHGDTNTSSLPTPALLGILEFSVEAEGPTASNVLFIPGTMESRLYTRDIFGRERQIWEPETNADISELAMNADGVSKEDVYTRDVIDTLYSNDKPLSFIASSLMKESAQLYGPFESYMDTLVSTGIIREWQTFPYDWRYEVSDIVRDGTRVATRDGEITTAHLQNTVQALASSSPTGRVTIIAHSNGGLIAKALAIDLQKDGKAGLIDKIILVGTPQFGTPTSIGTMLHGDGQTRALGLVSYAGTVRDIGVRMPGPYDLLPSPAYFDAVATPVMEFAKGAPSAYLNAFGAAIHSYDSFVSFLTNADGIRNTPKTSDLRSPTILSSDLISKSEDTHRTIDRWIAPDTLHVTSIVGTGRITPDGYTYGQQPINGSCDFSSGIVPNCSSVLGLSHATNVTHEGDDTVLTIPAAGNSRNVLYFDTAAYVRDSGHSIVHQSLLSALPIQAQITDLIKDSSSTELYLSTKPPPYDHESSLVISAGEHANIVVTDAYGNESGISPLPNRNDLYGVSENIPGSEVEDGGESKDIYLPDAKADYSVSLKGYEQGLTTLTIGMVDGDDSHRITHQFSSIRVSTSSTASLSIASGIPSPLDVDPGDGVHLTFTASDTVNVSDSISLDTKEADVSDTLVSKSFSHVSGSSVGKVTATYDSTFIQYLELEIKLLTLELDLVRLHRHS